MFLNPLIKHICKGLLILSLRIREDSEAISEPGLPYIVEKIPQMMVQKPLICPLGKQFSSLNCNW